MQRQLLAFRQAIRLLKFRNLTAAQALLKLRSFTVAQALLKICILATIEIHNCRLTIGHQGILLGLHRRGRKTSFTTHVAHSSLDLASKSRNCEVSN